MRNFITIIASASLASCAATYQEDGEAKQASVSWFGVQSFDEMSGNAGKVKGYKADHNVAAKEVGGVVKEVGRLKITGKAIDSAAGVGNNAIDAIQ